MDGSPEQLSGIKVWYDFDWKVEFNHTRTYRGFRNSRQLTAIVKAAAPDGKTAQLLLTKETGYSQDKIETDAEFVLVVNIDEFKQVTPNKAVSFFARKIAGSVVTLADFQKIVEDPEGRKAFFPLIKKPTLQEWLNEDSTRVTELLEVLSETHSIKLTEESKRRLLDLCLQAEPDTLAKLAECLTSAEPAKVLAAFERLDIESLQSLTAAANLGALKATLAQWEANKERGDEVTFWQRWFHQRPYILSQLFSYPVVIMEGSAYLGGTAIDRKGPKLADYLIKNKLTKNTAIIEIKTPITPIVSNKEYRGGVYAIDTEITGAIVQAATYKNTFIVEQSTLRDATRMNGGDFDFEVFDPPLFVIAGSLARLNSPTKRRSFELFRNGLSNAQLITFDELFERIQGLVTLLETVSNSAGPDAIERIPTEVTLEHPTEVDGYSPVPQEFTPESVTADTTKLPPTCVIESSSGEFGTDSGGVDGGEYVQPEPEEASTAKQDFKANHCEVEELANLPVVATCGNGQEQNLIIE